MNFAFSKYHALGNDYIVIDPKNLPAPLTTDQVKTICHRNFGVGSDGILLGPLPSTTAKCALKIYNPDGSLAEKSGNGVRIFSRYLWDTKIVGNDEFALQTDGGIVRSTVFDGGKMVRVEMGQRQFRQRENSRHRPEARSHQRKNFRGRTRVHLLRGDHWQSALRAAAAGNQRKRWPENSARCWRCIRIFRAKPTCNS